MRKLPWIAFCLFHFCACKNKSERDAFKGKEFEGLITYRITYDNYPAEYGYGDTMLVWYSKGNLVKLFNNKLIKGLRKEIFLVKGNKYFFQVGNSDSLFSGDIGTEKRTKLLHSQHSFTDTRILGHTCEQIEQEMEFTKTKANVLSTYLYSKGVLPMNSDYFSGKKFASFDRYMDEAGEFYLHFKGTAQYADKTGLSSYIFTAIKIQGQPVDPALFSVDTSIVRPFPLQN